MEVLEPKDWKDQRYDLNYEAMISWYNLKILFAYNDQKQNNIYTVFYQGDQGLTGTIGQFGADGLTVRSWNVEWK